MTAKRFDLGFLALLARERGVTVTKGFLDADLAIDGTFAQNHPRGSLRISDGDLRLTEMMETFHEASLELTLGPGDAVAVQLDARVGNDGRLSLSGTANLVGLSLRDARGTFASHKLSVSAGKTAAEIDARGSFTGVRQADLYLVTTTLEEGAINLPKLSGGKVHPTGVPDDVVFIDARGRREPVEPRAAGAPFLRVRLRTDQPILVTSQELRAELDVMLNVTLAPRATTINGQIRIETGFAVLFGRRWSFQASTLFFGGESPPDPRLDIKLGYEFQATTVVIALAGTLAKPELALLAESGDYDQAQLLGFVLGGSPDDGGPASGGDVSQQALGAGVGLVLGQLQPLLKKVVPVDVVSLQTRTGAKEDTLFTVGKWFFSDLFVAYQQRFGSQADEQQNTYEGRLEWYFARGFRLDLIFGDRGEGSADVLSIHRW